MTGAGWRDRAGAWLSIGSSPAALVLGAGLAARHGGAVPVVPVALGVTVMIAILAGQGMLGLAPPLGTGRTLTGLAPTFLPVRSRHLLGVLLALAMIGWLGFNLGLGGAGLAAMLGVPDFVGALLLGLPVWAFSDGGMERWNRVAVIATGAALLLGVVVAVQLTTPLSPLSTTLPPVASLGIDLGVFIGYVSVFGVRTPDFSAGLRRRRDLAVSVSLLIVPFLVMAGLGVMLYRVTTSTDLVGTLAGPEGIAVGNLLVAVAVIGPSFTIVYSGALALRSLVSSSDRYAVSVIAVAGLLLAVLRFDRHLLPWLATLAAALPALVVPMVIEGVRRRRGGTPRPVPVWTWAPASGVALLATSFGIPVAPVLAIVLATATTIVWVLPRRGGAGPGTTSRAP